MFSRVSLRLCKNVLADLLFSSRLWRTALRLSVIFDSQASNESLSSKLDSNDDLELREGAKHQWYLTSESPRSAARPPKVPDQMQEWNLVS